MYNTLPGWTIKEKIYESPGSLLYRGTGETDANPVILKILKEDYPGKDELIRYRQEYEITRKLNIDGVIKCYGQERYGNGLAIILEDIQGESLKILLSKHIFSLTNLISLAIRLSEILGKIHENSVIHKDINPSNIIYNPTSDQLRFIDFGIASTLPRENPVLKNPERLEGTLAYMSPEQTGRMNRPLDYRTDYYALGAAYYELFTGRTVFETNDPIELLHSHLALEPIAPHEIKPGIPLNLSRVILKLLEKRAEDRYQTTGGLRYDLIICQKELETNTRIEGFIPGSQDVSSLFILPQKLYGREKERSLLLKNAERAAKNRSEALFIAGPSGVGKTSLVRELYKPMTARSSYFIGGKFDQYLRNTPYSALQAAFQDLIGQLLTENEINLLNWKDELQDALGKNGKVMTDFIPELASIIDEYPALPELEPAEARNRFTLTFQNFIEVFLREGRSLILFLDDLQWADLASLNLIHQMTKDNQCLFFIGAYRDNETSPTHPLMLTQKDMHKDWTPMETISLAPLELVHIREYIADAVNIVPEACDELASLVKTKTNGNPFFIEEFLGTIIRKELLFFNSKKLSWEWNLKQIQELNITENVVELITGRMKNLPAETHAVLIQAACLGNSFDLKTLSLLHGKTQAETAGDAWPLLEQNILLPLNDEYKIAEFVDDDSRLKTELRYKFAHDRIEEAAYSLMTPDGMAELHLRAGRLLLKNTTPAERELKLFKIVDHLNVSRKLINEESERDELAKLNLRAGWKAKLSNAYTAALGYYEEGLELLGERKWSRRYELTLALYIPLLETNVLLGQLNEMEERFREAEKKVVNALDRVKIYEVRIYALTTQNRTQDAVNSAIDILGRLGVKLPQNPGKIRVLIGLIRTKFSLLWKTPESLKALPKMKKTEILAAMRILVAMTSPAFKSVPKLFPLIIFHMMNLSLKHGQTEESPFAYAIYGSILCGVLGEIEQGYKFGKVAVQLVQKEKNRKIFSRVLFAYIYLNMHWKTPYSETIPLLKECYKTGMDNGDLQGAGYALNLWLMTQFHLNRELGTLEEEIQSYTRNLSQLERKATLNYINLQRQKIQVFRNPKILNSAFPDEILSGEFFNETQTLPEDEEQNNFIALNTLYLTKTLIFICFQDFPRARKFSEMCGKNIQVDSINLKMPLFVFLDSLSNLGVYERSSKLEQRAIRKQVRKNQKKLKNWAKFSPANYLHRIHLVEAELARVQGNELPARKHYETATHFARKNHFLMEEALTWELGGRFYLSNEQPEFAQFYFKNAHYVYSRWGAEAKVAHIEKSYPEFFASQKQASATSQTRGNITLSTTNRKFHHTLDLTALWKASQTIDGELELDKLMDKVVHILQENSGARRSVLLLKREDAYLIKAESYAEQEDGKKIKNAPLEESDLPLSLINYVIRTQKKVSLTHASQNGPFLKDPIIQKNHSRSILCMPLTHQGELLGVIYLENNLTEGLFDNEYRLNMLEILGSWTATSIRNASSRQAEEARIKAEAANRAKSEFLASMSHELRTPLNGILGYAGILERSQSLDEREKEQASTIWHCGDHLLRLINDILDLSKIEAQRMELTPSDFRLPEFLESIVKLFKVQANEKKLAFVYDPQLPLPSGIHADEKKLRQILINLIQNAMRYTNTGQINFRAAYNDEKLRFDIEDTGVGIAPEDRAKIFEPFRQVGVAHSAKTGTGLGLSICKQLAELMGGQLDVISTPGQGSTFSFEVSLPQTSVIAEFPMPLNNIVNYQGDRRKILIVDDDKTNRNLLRDLLGPIGFELEEAANGKEALTKAQGFIPDLVLMDSSMPVMNGLDCSREIRKAPLLNKVKIIGLSAGVFEKDRQESLRAGADEFLSKPVKNGLLLNTLAEQLALEWNYEQGEMPDRVPTLLEEEILPPSPERCLKLLELAQRGDIQGVLEFVDELEAEPALQAYVQQVRKLARAFQLKKLTEFAQRFVG